MLYASGEGTRSAVAVVAESPATAIGYGAHRAAACWEATSVDTTGNLVTAALGFSLPYSSDYPLILHMHVARAKRRRRCVPLCNGDMKVVKQFSMSDVVAGSSHVAVRTLAHPQCLGGLSPILAGEGAPDHPRWAALPARRE
jgi:hypothetical protein